MRAGAPAAPCRAQRPLAVPCVFGSRPRALSRRRPAPLAGARRSRTRSIAYVAAASDAAPGIFPAGKRQAKVDIPAVWVSVSVADAATDDFASDLDEAIQAGATAVLLSDTQTGGADLFKAAAQVKETVRGRVVVLVQDRADIATACQLDGVMLTPDGAHLRVAVQRMHSLHVKDPVLAYASVRA